MEHKYKTNIPDNKLHGIKIKQTKNLQYEHSAAITLHTTYDSHNY